MLLALKPLGLKEQIEVKVCWPIAYSIILEIAASIN